MFNVKYSDVKPYLSSIIIEGESVSVVTNELECPQEHNIWTHIIIDNKPLVVPQSEIANVLRTYYTNKMQSSL